MSHELRTPLTPILAAVSARLEHATRLGDLRRAGDDPAQRRAARPRLIDDLLDISRIERGRLHLDLEVVDVHEVIERAVEICREEVLVVGLKLVLDLAATRHHVKGDPARLMQIAWNLVQNAVEVHPRGRDADDPHVTTRPGTSPALRDDLLAIEFEDTGQGIEPEFLPRIFDPFEQRPRGPSRPLRRARPGSGHLPFAGRGARRKPGGVQSRRGLRIEFPPRAWPRSPHRPSETEEHAAPTRPRGRAGP